MHGVGQPPPPPAEAWRRACLLKGDVANLLQLMAIMEECGPCTARDSILESRCTSRLCVKTPDF